MTRRSPRRASLASTARNDTVPTTGPISTTARHSPGSRCAIEAGIVTDAASTERWIADVLDAPNDDAVIARVRRENPGASPEEIRKLVQKDRVGHDFYIASFPRKAMQAASWVDQTYPGTHFADKGVRVANSINFSATMTSGVQNLIYVKPLLTMPMTTIGVAAERDLLNQIPSLPRVYDGACLAWMMYAGAATPVNSAFYGHLDFGWS